MSKLLLSGDDYIYRYNGKFYVSGVDRLEFFRRYTRVFSKLRVAFRCIEERELKPSRVLIEDTNIEFYPLPIFHGPKEYLLKYFEIGRQISRVADGCDAAILRLPSTVAQRISKHVLKARIPYATEIVFDANDGANTANTFIEKILWRVIDYQMRHTCYSANGVAPVTQYHLQKRYFSKRQNSFSSYYSSLALPKDFFSSPRKYPNKQIFEIAHINNQISIKGRKGTAEIIRAISKLKEKGLVVYVNFAGDDWNNSTEKIYRYAENYGVLDQVKCVGYLNRKQINSFLEKSDMLVLPTKAEGLPRVIIEAIAKGLPVITTPASGNPELVPEQFLVEYDDVEMLSKKIQELVTDKFIYEQASECNFKKALAYEASVLELRRDAFYTELQKCIL